MKSEEHIKVEISHTQEVDDNHQLIGRLSPHVGHTLFRINTQTMDIEATKFRDLNIDYFPGENYIYNKEVVIQEGFAYVSALNKKNALKKYLKGQTGTKFKDMNFLKL